MKVTVGAIRQIVREEAERLEETQPGMVGSQDIRNEFGASSETTSQILDMEAGPLRNALVALIDGLTDKADALKVQSLKIAADRLGVDLGDVAKADNSDEGSSHTSGYEEGKASDEGSSQTSGFRPDGSGRASNEAIGRAGLRNLIMQEASSIVGE